MAKDLNALYNYKISRSARYAADHLLILRANPSRSKDDWTKDVYSTLKAFIKDKYYLQQTRRCAYCRERLNIDAYYNHLDHVVPKSSKPRWMFEPKNLVITCEQCNSLKNANNTLTQKHTGSKFPKTKAGFLIFNPHHEKWGDVFEIEDGMFIRGKNQRGADTIRICKLYQYQYSIKFSEEANVKKTSAIKRAALRMRLYDSATVEHQAAEKIIEYCKKLIK